MSDTLIAQGGIATIGSLGDYDSQFNEGEKGRVELNCRLAVGADVISDLASQLHYLGVPESRVEVSGANVYIYFTKRIAPLVIIALAIAAVIIIVGLIIAWKIWKISPAAVGTGILVLLLGIAAIYLIIRSRGSS